MVFERGVDRGFVCMALIDEELTQTVIGAFHAVYNKLGSGFLENVYVGAPEHE
jgi:hypothetical protein